DVPRGGSGAGEAEDRQRSVWMPAQRLLEERDRLGGTAERGEHLPEQFRRRLDRRLQSERRRQLRFAGGGGLQNRDRFVTAAGRVRDRRRELTFHQRDR